MLVSRDSITADTPIVSVAMYALYFTNDRGDSPLDHGNIEIKVEDRITCATNIELVNAILGNRMDFTTPDSIIKSHLNSSFEIKSKLFHGLSFKYKEHEMSKVSQDSIEASSTVEYKLTFGPVFKRMIISFIESEGKRIEVNGKKVPATHVKCLSTPMIEWITRWADPEYQLSSTRTKIIDDLFSFFAFLQAAEKLQGSKNALTKPNAYRTQKIITKTFYETKIPQVNEGEPHPWMDPSILDRIDQEDFQTVSNRPKQVKRITQGKTYPERKQRNLRQSRKQKNADVPVIEFVAPTEHQNYEEKQQREPVRDTRPLFREKTQVAKQKKQASTDVPKISGGDFVSNVVASMAHSVEMTRRRQEAQKRKQKKLTRHEQMDEGLMAKHPSLVEEPEPQVYIW